MHACKHAVEAVSSQCNYESHLQNTWDTFLHTVCKAVSMQAICHLPGTNKRLFGKPCNCYLTQKDMMHAFGGP